MISKSLRAAVHNVVRSVGTLDLRRGRQHGWQQPRLDTALFLSWAPSVHRLYLDTHSLNMPGLPAFAQAAGDQLSVIRARCNSMLAVMQAGHVLSSCIGPVSLELVGTHAPSALPPNMVSVRLKLVEPRAGGAPFKRCDPLTPHALMYSAARLCSSLKHVSLACKEVAVQLAWPFTLPQLDTLRLELSLRCGTSIDLSWLQRQPCSRLDMVVAVLTDQPSEHQLMVQQLLQLSMHNLTVRWQVALTPDLQLLWQRPFPCRRIRLELAAPMPDALHALPCSPVLVIESYHHDLSVEWAAVSRHAAQICFIMGHRQLSFLNGCSMPNDLDGAWQLSVCSSAVQGWGGTRAIGNMCYLQNAAATTAGWKWQAQPPKAVDPLQ